MRGQDAKGEHEDMGNSSQNINRVAKLPEPHG